MSAASDEKFRGKKIVTPLASRRRDVSERGKKMVPQHVDSAEEQREERRSGRRQIATLRAMQPEDTVTWQKRKRIIPEIEKLKNAGPTLLEHPIRE